MDNSSGARNRIENMERLLKFIREVFVFIGVILLVIYFFPALDGLRQRLEPQNIESLSVGPISLKLKADITVFAPTNIALEAVSGPAFILEKGSTELLAKVREQMKSKKGARIDVLLIVPGKIYSGELLQKYIALLNARFVVFQSSHLEGWMDASGFATQLEPPRHYSYEDLLKETVGINLDITDKTSSAKSVLEKMQSAHLDNLAVVDSHQRFQFMVNRQDILSKVVTSAILAQ